MSSTTRSGGLLLGTLIGGVIGAASAFLLAPKTGAKMREDLASKYRSMNGKLQQLASRVGDKTADVVSAVGQKTQNISGNAMDVKVSKEEIKREADRQPYANYNKN